MRIGYPCINRSLECRGNKTFRLNSYSEEYLIRTVENNLACLRKMLEFNVDHDLLFFRISSDLVPFASHPVNQFQWDEYFREQFHSLGEFIEGHGFRISMHPDQFTVVNSPDEDVFERSRKELEYHVQVMELLGLGREAKIQIHVGGVYDDKEESVDRFRERYHELDQTTRRHLVIENDDRLYALKDCLTIAEETGIPVLFDTFHHEILNRGETLSESYRLMAGTWEPEDGIPMIDYSSQEPGGRAGKHAESIHPDHFVSTMNELGEQDADIMLEIKDKEKSAIIAIDCLSGKRE